MRQFFTETGIEVPAVTGAQMRELDRIAMEETGPNLFQMMENACRDLAQLTIDLLGHRWDRSHVYVLAGPGGNGRGGICGARHLANRGVKVSVCIAEPDHLRPVPAFQRKLFAKTSGAEIDLAQLGDARPDFLIDALFGYGMNGHLHGPALELLRWANDSGVPVLALDVPSGLDATTGEAPGEFVHAKWTMSLALPKTGLYSDKAGALFLADIGIPDGVYRTMGLPYAAPFGPRFVIPLLRVDREVPKGY